MRCCLKFPFPARLVSGWKKLRKRLRACKTFSLSNGGRRIHGKGGYVDIVARWAGVIRFEVCGHLYRYRLLLMRDGDNGYGFAIRQNKNVKIAGFPGFDFSESEVKLLLRIADEISPPEKEIKMKFPNFVRKSMRQMLREESDSYSHETVHRLLKNDFFRIVFSAGLLANLEAFKRPDERARFAINIRTFQCQESVLRCAEAILRAVDFTADECCERCAQISVKGVDDLELWSGRINQLTVLGFRSEKQIRKIWKELEKIVITGEPSPFAALPILSGNSSLPQSVVFEICPPAECPPLSASDLQELRAATAFLLKRRHEVLERMDMELERLERIGESNMATYPITRIKAFLWSVGGVLFDDAKFESYMEKSVEHMDQVRDRMAMEQHVLEQAVEMLFDWQRYSSQIVAKPTSGTQAEEMLATDAIAFIHQTKDDGPALCFSEESLLRLLSKAGLTAELFDRFIVLLKGKGYLEERRKNISFPDRNAKRFYAVSGKCFRDFSVSSITALRSGRHVCNT